MSEAVLIALIGILGSAGGLFTLVKALIDARAHRADREMDADERLAERLERRLDAAEEKSADLDRRLAAAEQYIAILTLTLAREGKSIPPRPTS